MLTDEQRAIAIGQYKRGVSPTEIGEQFGTTGRSILQMARRAGCPPQNQKLSEQGHRSADARRRKKVQDQRNEINREMTANKRAAGLTGMARRGRGKINTTYQEPAGPVDDTRCFTARFCGDPLPGRSALDRRQAAAGE